jgi:hypothetical protein
VSEGLCISKLPKCIPIPVFETTCIPECKNSCLPTSILLADAWKPEAGIFGSAADLKAMEKSQYSLDRWPGGPRSRYVLPVQAFRSSSQSRFWLNYPRYYTIEINFWRKFKSLWLYMYYFEWQLLHSNNNNNSSHNTDINNNNNNKVKVNLSL